MTAPRNPFAYAKAITLDSLPDLFSHHRGITAGWSMEDDPPADPPKADDPPAYVPPASQADLDRIIGERLARDRERFKDYDDLKKRALEFDNLVEASRTEQEKAVDAARKEGETTATQAANSRLVKAEARALAAQAGFRSLSDVSLLDLSDVTVGDDGNVDAAAVKAKLKELSDAEPWRLDDGKKPAPKPDRSQGGGGGSDRTPSVSAGRDLFAERHKKAAAS